MSPPDSLPPDNPLADALVTPARAPAGEGGGDRSSGKAMTAEMTYRRVAAGAVARPRAVRAAPPAPAPRLAAGPDERVRQDLAAKLAEIAASIGDVDQRRLVDHVANVLGAVVAEAGRQLRAAIPELIEDWPEADCRVLLDVLELVELKADEPLLRLLPLLTGDDLMAVIAAPLAAGAGRMIASRPRLSDGGGEALARAARPAPVQTLLASAETATREATLDALLAREAGHPEWSEPLVGAPALPPRAARALAGLVARQMLAALQGHPRVAQPIRDELRTRLEHRLSGQIAQRFVEPSAQESVATAHRLKRAGALNEAVLVAAAQRGESRLVAAMLAVAAGVPVSAVDRAVSLRSSKGLISLIWRAGFSMAPAGPVQSLLARVPPDALLLAGPDGAFPLSVEEMRWQLEFLARLGR